MTKANYVDGFVLVVPKEKVSAYRRMALEAGKIWKKFGALDYKECMLDDVKPEWVTLTFPKLAKAKKDETVWFSYITFKSRAHRDQVNARVMQAMEKKYDHQDKKQMEKMPFDMKRMAYGGFRVMVDA
ncbi:MAG: DUF1428 domain-containing protein [Patescibacteria group bacterium]